MTEALSYRDMDIYIVGGLQIRRQAAVSFSQYVGRQFAVSGNVAISLKIRSGHEEHQWLNPVTAVTGKVRWKSPSEISRPAKRNGGGVRAVCLRWRGAAHRLAGRRRRVRCAGICPFLNSPAARRKRPKMLDRIRSISNQCAGDFVAGDVAPFRQGVIGVG
jgi:hypothetical protein